MTYSRRLFSIELRGGLCCLLMFGCLTAVVRADDEQSRRDLELVSRKLMDQATREAVDRGLAYLVEQQHPEGAFGSGTVYQSNVAVTSLAGLALVASGDTPGRGRYGKQVDLAIDYLLSQSHPSGYVVASESMSHGPMYGHGFSTLFLAEVYGMAHQQRLRDALEKAVRLIVNSQQKEGGWRYYPDSQDADISVTVCQVMALRAARNCGLTVPKQTIERSVAYVKQCQNPDGGYRYQLARRAESQFPRSAAAVVALYSAGIYEGREIDRGLQYLTQFQPRGAGVRYESHYYYGHYYAVQVMWQAGGEYWMQWYPAIRDELLRKQLPDGRWPDNTICPEYATAMACLILQVPNNALPIFQR